MDLSKLSHIIKCIKCESNKLNFSDVDIVCEKCNTIYKYLNKQAYFNENYFEEKKWSDKNKLFKLNNTKILFNKINGPKIKDLKDIYKISGPSVNLGSGEDNFPGFINVDLGVYKNVDIIAHVGQLPFIDNSIDLIASNSVLEHILDYNLVINEVYRVLKPSGIFYLCVPNLCARHHEIDYHRWTTPGIENLLIKKFLIIDKGLCKGVAHSLISHVNAIIDIKVNNFIFNYLISLIWKFISLPLFLMSDDNTEDNQSIAHTIYIVGKKIT